MIFLSNKNNFPPFLYWFRKVGKTLKLSHTFLIVYFIGLFCPFLAAQINFQEVASNYQINHRFEHNTIGGGVCIYDFDKDGLDDLTLSSTLNQPIGFYRNTGNGFEQLSLIEENQEIVKQMNWVDFDNDGDADLSLIHI